MPRPLSVFRALTFDCYGTLIDWETGIWDALQPLVMENRAGLDRSGALAAFARLESAQQAETPRMLYPQVLARVHQGLADHFGMRSTAALNDAFGASLPHWPAFPDTAEALRRLAGRYRLVILSNVHRAGFAASSRKLGAGFDAVYTAEDVGAYKPAPANFEHMLERLGRDHGIAADEVLHTAQSLFHDHVPARAFGLANVWIDRQRLSESGRWGATAEVAEPPGTDYRFFTLAEMADAVDAAFG